MFFSFRSFYPVACLVSCSLLAAAHAEIPLLSSKAVRLSLKAKEAIEGHDEKAIEQAVECLHGLLRESSFRRLEPQAQVHILLLLSKGFERLEKYKEQEQLLLSCAKREELYRFQVPLKTALARSFIQQHRLREAEQILEKIIKSSCAHLPLEEKGAIANVVVFRDEYLSYLLRQGDKLAEMGKGEEALKLYDLVLSTMHRQQFPYQSSPVEQKRLRQKILLRTAEVHFQLGKFEEAISAVKDWDESLFFTPADQPLLTRRLFLIAAAYQKLQDEKSAAKWFAAYFSSPYLKRPFLDKHAWCSPLQFNQTAADDQILSPALVLWKAQEALQAGSSDMIAQSSALLQKKIKSSESIIHLLRGFHAFLEQNSKVAIQELSAGLANPISSLDTAWREASFHLLAECAFERMMVLTCAHQQKEAEEMAKELLPLFPSHLHPSTLLRIGAIQLFLFHAAKDPTHLSALQNILDQAAASKRPYSHALFCFLKTSKMRFSSQDPSENSGNQTDCLSDCDRFLAARIGMSDLALSSENSYHLDESKPNNSTHQGDRNFHELTVLPYSSEQSSSNTHDIGGNLLSQHLAALLLYQQAMADEIPADQATSALHKCLESAGLEDARPQILHCLMDIAIHTNQFADADELINELVSGYPRYPMLSQAALSCIFAFEDSPYVSNERLSLCQYILERPKPDIHTLLLITHLFETRQQLPFEYKTAAPYFSLALIDRAEARTLVREAASLQEPSAIKERVQAAKKAFDSCRMNIHRCMETFHDSESLCCLWSLVFGSANEQIELMEQYITSDSAFNELPLLLEDAAATLRQDLSEYEKTVPSPGQLIQPAFLQTSVCLSDTAELYAKTFRRDLEGALQKSKDFPPEWLSSSFALRSLLYVSKALRESNRPEEALAVLSNLHEAGMRENIELALEIAMEKSLCLRELHHPDTAMTLLAWVINGPYASSLRVKAMILRADLYLSLHRTDLAIRQLESVAAKGGEWGAVANRKLKEFYEAEGNNGISS
jgi:hypothetical protein